MHTENLGLVLYPGNDYLDRVLGFDQEQGQIVVYNPVRACDSREYTFDPLLRGQLRMLLNQTEQPRSAELLAGSGTGFDQTIREQVKAAVIEREFYTGKAAIREYTQGW